MTGYEWYGRNRDCGKWASGDMAVLVQKSLESGIRKGLAWVELCGVGRKMIVGIYM